MPRRATLTYSSEDAPAVNSGKLFVYYCKFSGKQVPPNLLYTARQACCFAVTCLLQRLLQSLLRVISKAEGSLRVELSLRLGLLSTGTHSQATATSAKPLEGAQTTR